MHTAFAGDSDYQEKYDAMKIELEKFIDTDTTSEEEYEFYEHFTSKY